MRKPSSLTWNHQRSWPSAIVHLDADSFFASCEQAVHPEYRGKPIITGAERGIAASMSYEAKARGVKRGMSLLEIKKLVPDIIVVPSDYETYSLFSKRMFTIMRRYTSSVEEYSIDEAFADITGLRRPLRMSYSQIGRAMKDTVQKELGITVSVGVAPTKVLAKAAANFHKPDCFEVVTTKDIAHKLKLFPVSEVWGIGPQTTAHLEKFGVQTAYDFAALSEDFIFSKFTKPHQEIWLELRGHKVYKVAAQEKGSYYSISKTKTFTPATNNKEYVFSQLLKNLENACIKARRYNLAAREIYILLRTQDFKHAGMKARLNRVSNVPNEIVDIAGELFEKIYTPDSKYRLTGFILAGLMPAQPTQVTLFESPLKLEKLQKVYQAVDKLSARYGKHTVHLAAADHAHNKPAHQGGRAGVAFRKKEIFKGETNRQRIGIPLLPS